MQLIIPAFNEERRLAPTLHTLRDYAVAAKDAIGPIEVIVVDNASTDATAEVARSCDSTLMPVHVVRCRQRGKGAAVRAGMAVTDADVVGFMDADGATDLHALARALQLIADGADVAVASRALPDSITWERHSSVRAAGATLYRRLSRTIVPSVLDTQCGFKVFRGHLAREVFAATTTAGFSFDVEVLARCAAAGATLAEFPVTWVDVPGSTFVPSRHGASSFLELAVIAVDLRIAALRRRRAAAVVTRLPEGVPVLTGVADLALVAES